MLILLGFWSLQKPLQHGLIYLDFRLPALKLIKCKFWGLLLITVAPIQDAHPSRTLRKSETVGWQKAFGKNSRHHLWLKDLPDVQRLIYLPICPLELFQLRPGVRFKQRFAKHLWSESQAGRQLENLLTIKVLGDSDYIRLGNFLDFLRWGGWRLLKFEKDLAHWKLKHTRIVRGYKKACDYE
jgi:hypothetical protein